MNLDYNYFLHGAVSGMFGVILSHPFDTIKSNIQNNQKIIYKVRFLYNGITPALSGVGLEKAIVFGTFINSKKLLSNKIKNENLQNAISGALSGLTASTIVTPVDRIKILLQNNKNIQSLKPSYLFNGLSATISREVPGFAIYFTTYHYLKQKFENKNSHLTKLCNSFLFGGVSGAFSWIFIYPQDLVKTQLQSLEYSNTKNIKSIILDIYNKHGIKRFYKGFHLSLLRAIPLHAGTFFAMEFITILKN